jgi:hypothetical protein
LRFFVLFEPAPPDAPVLPALLGASVVTALLPGTFLVVPAPPGDTPAGG